MGAVEEKKDNQLTNLESRQYLEQLEANRNINISLSADAFEISQLT